MKSKFNSIKRELPKKDHLLSAMRQTICWLSRNLSHAYYVRHSNPLSLSRQMKLKEFCQSKAEGNQVTSLK